MTLQSWAREPLVHFLIGGVVIYAVLTLRGGDVDPASRSIVIDREQQAQIALVFERTMNRPPTDAELDAQIERFIRDEVLYREALRLGLDQGDAVVRRRMAQKMDILASSQAETVQPSEQTLRTHYEANPEAFANEVAYTLDQLWFEERPVAQSILLRIDETGDWESLGQEISLPTSIESTARDELAARFGQQFMQEIDRLDLGEGWQGPISSGFGWHLVRLRARDASEIPEFDDVRQEVESHWRTQTIAQRKADAYQLLRDAYSVTIEN